MPALESRRVRTQPRSVSGASCGARPARMSAHERDVIGRPVPERGVPVIGCLAADRRRRWLRHDEDARRHVILAVGPPPRRIAMLDPTITPKRIVQMLD